MAAEQHSWSATRLTQTTMDGLLGYGARAQWPSGFLIYHRGAAADGVFIVVRGRIVLRSRVRGGRGFIPWIATAGETFGGEGLSGDARYSTDARADEESETLFVSGSQFRSLLREQPQHAGALVAQLQCERAALLDKLWELTTMSVEQRLVVALMRMSAFDTFTRRDGALELTPSRYRLVCELVGATRESVSLVLSRFAGEGLVDRHGTRSIVYADRLTERLDRLPVSDLLAAESVGARKAAMS
jgi:CRP/FNR family transcriptional regulator, cyclic AMP receptor protein